MAILNLSEYYTENKPKSGNEEEIVQMPDRRTQQQKEPLLKGLDSKYIDQATINGITNRAQNQTSTINETKVNTSVKGGGNMGSAIGAAAGFASDVVQLNSSVAQNDKEANARAGKLALSGMTAGATIGSVIPGVGTVIGAAAGAVIGGTVGLLKKVPDRKKRLKTENENYNNRMFAMTNQTNQMASNALIQEELQNQQNLAKAQMGLLDLKY